LGTIVAGSSAEYTITVLVDPEPPASITNNASVSSGVSDPDTGNNDASEETSLDDQPPTITLVDTVLGTGDGELSDCETALDPIFQVLVTFSEPVQDPSGDSDPDDVTNPDNYRIIYPGPDFDFQTDACGDLLGDDEAATIYTVTYDDLTNTATVVLEHALAAAQRRLLVCGSTSIYDLAGNPLDGDGDGTGGDDFGLAFRSDPGNLLANGHFDCDLDHWTVTTATPSEIEYSTDDSDSASESGSAHIMQLAMDTDFELSPCVVVAPKLEYYLAGRVRLSVGRALVLGTRKI
ncbi:MAG: hypothetical protein GY842_23325, partial [bacterium]|nr:hypothetical protein [bacterium]